MKNFRFFGSFEPELVLGDPDDGVVDLNDVQVDLKSNETLPMKHLKNLNDKCLEGYHKYRRVVLNIWQILN